MLAIGFLIISFIRLMNSFLFLVFLQCLLWMDTEFYQNFFCIHWNNYAFFLYSLLMWNDLNFWMFNQLCIFWGINPIDVSFFQIQRQSPKSVANSVQLFVIHGLQPARLLCPWDFPGLPFPSSGGVPNPGMEPTSPALEENFLPLNNQGSPMLFLLESTC